MTDFARDTHTTGTGWGWTLAYGIVSILVGILAFSAPFPATLAATIVVGFFFLAGGVASLVAGFSSRTSHRGYAVFFGILSVLAGGYMVLVPVGGALSLTLMAILWLAARGIMELIFGFRFKRLRVPMLLLGALNLLLAIALYTTVPWSALTLPGYILGASFLFGGIVAVMNAFAERRGA
ncbi:HdeD family acid-resistance protein [Sphingomonas hankookensis]|uniref:HdeD family acid-resistance protein n=1 Tax=Sphingomonas hengshuiensis TaxID=1609977 RepID=A0A2W5B9X6_9SPHN|nr:MAG: hypothetical protein DI632_03375 [Sphingomonas hengshuiensis]